MDVSAFNQHEANDILKAQHQTFVHLFPQGLYYEGIIRISYSVYGDYSILDEKIDISAAPWWYEAVNNFAADLINSDEIERAPV